MGERKDKIKNKSEVAKSLIKDPTKTQREIAEETGLSLGNVNDKVNQIEQTGTESQILDKILKMDHEIIDLANQITLKKIKEEAPKDEQGDILVDKLSLSQVKIIGELANNSTKRKAIFGDKDKKDKTIKFIIT